MPPLKIVFMGTPDFSVPALHALAHAGHDILCVYTQPPRPAGRGKALRASPVHKAAEAAGWTVRHPVSLKTADTQAAFRDLNPDLAVVAAYGLILPPPILEAPRLGCLNIHASLLPRWRGAAPIQRAIMAGDDKSGVTIMKMDVGLDTGPMLATVDVPITSETTAGALHDALAQAGAGLMISCLGAYASGALVPKAQPKEGITYAEKLTRADERLDWAQDAAVLERQVRALSPYPGARFNVDGTSWKLLGAVVESAPNGSGAAPGTVVDDALGIVCGDGRILRPRRLQRPGKKPMAAEAVLMGAPVPVGTCLD